MCLAVVVAAYSLCRPPPCRRETQQVRWRLLVLSKARLFPHVKLFCARGILLDSDTFEKEQHAQHIGNRLLQLKEEGEFRILFVDSRNAWKLRLMAHRRGSTVTDPREGLRVKLPNFHDFLKVWALEWTHTAISWWMTSCFCQ